MGCCSCILLEECNSSRNMRFPFPWMISSIFIIEQALSKKSEMFVVDSVKTLAHRDVNTASQKSLHNFEVAQERVGAQAQDTAGWSTWSSWSACRGGLRTRRRHCLLRHACGESLRVETKRCAKNEERGGANAGSRREHTPYNSSQIVITVISSAGATRSAATLARSEGGGEGGGAPARQQQSLRGFSPWSPWSKCSRKCTTVRKRHCRRRAICGRKVVRESAYCYLEGSYCHTWLTNMTRRSNSESYTVELTPMQRIATQHRQSFTMVPRREPLCGRINPPGGLSHLHESRRWPGLRIIGGRTAAPGKWPWQVVVLNKFKEAFCGGTLVSLRWVLTAAHCVRRRLFVRLGEHDLRTRGAGELELRVAQAIVHPMYDPDTVDNDVAMLRLPVSGRPELGHGVACLPRPYQQLPPHTSCTILGWGKRNAGDDYGTNLLQEAQVSTVAQSLCRRVYWEYAITDNMVCAGRGRRDSCAGDSGGPLLCRQRDGDVTRYVIHGITSFGDGCGKRGKYGIYTRTSNYVPWIQHVLRKQYDLGGTV